VTKIDFEDLERKYSRALNIVIGIIVAGGIAGLFLFDISRPRGEVDGVGYAALVALCVRFGNRSVVGCAALTTFLTLIGSVLVPDAGISVAGMWANRGFAIAEIWIVAAILLRRLQLEDYIAVRERVLQVNQAALGRIVREALLPDKTQSERIRCIVEIAAETLQTDLAAILQAAENSKTFKIMDIWDRSGARHFVGPDIPVNQAPGYVEAMRKHLVVAVDDVFHSPFPLANLPFLELQGIRSVLAADTFMHDRGFGAVAFAFRQPHHWTTQEIAFGRAVASLVALLFAASRNAETLATLEQVSEGIYAEDQDGTLQYANRAARELSARAVDGTSSFPRPGMELATASDMHEIVHDGRDLEIQRLRLPGGGILTRINDVSVRNAALSERRRLEARGQQSAKMEAIGQLAGGVAHDFNNILGSILGFAGFLTQDLPAQSAEHGFAERILGACERGKELVEQILAFARAKTVERGVVDLGLLLKRNREYLAGLMPPRVTLNLALADGPMPLFGSAVQTMQLITNLCLNARDALDGGVGTISIATGLATQQEIADIQKGTDAADERSFGDVQPGRPYCVLRVEDDGQGIAPATLDRIFEPFFTTKGRHRGTGLGLAVVHGVVESTGGACRVRSVIGRGTVFSIYFPLAGRSPDESEQPANPHHDLRGRERVLIVDDERDMADMLAIGLERLGYETVGVNDPLEALAAISEDPDAFDVVITDQVMPGLRGLDLIRRIKEIRPAIKAILCTGYSDGANEAVSRAAGADGFFAKPVDARQIALGLRALMQNGSKE
jgi:signal transduction histidine kinase/ActR/RegA family two-component response regulator